MNPRDDSSSVDGGPFQFSLTTLLVIVAGVAVIAAGGSFGFHGVLLSMLVAGVAWARLAGRIGAYGVAYYVTGATQGALLAAFFPGPFYVVSRPLGEVLQAVIYCVAALLAVRLCRRFLLAPDKRVPWLGVLLPPYVVGCCVILATYYTAIDEKFAILGIDGVIVEVFLLAWGSFWVITILMPVAFPLSLLFCLWLRAVARIRPEADGAEPSDKPDAEEDAEKPA